MEVRIASLLPPGAESIKQSYDVRSLRVRKATWHVVKSQVESIKDRRHTRSCELLTPVIPRNELSINSFVQFYVLYHLSTRTNAIVV